MQTTWRGLNASKKRLETPTGNNSLTISQSFPQVTFFVIDFRLVSVFRFNEKLLGGANSTFYSSDPINLDI